MWDYLRFTLIEHSLGIFFCTVLYLAPVVLYFRRKNEKKSFSKEKLQEVHDPIALARAEEEARNSGDLREQFLEKMVSIKTFQSIDGYDHSSMSRLIEILKSKDIFCDYYFDQSLPAGVFSYTGPTGSYELFVPPEKEEEARQILKLQKIH